MCEDLQEMILYHVAQCARLLIITSTVLNTDGLGGGDLDVVDVVSVPDRFEYAVGKSECQQVLYRFLAEEVVDAVCLILAENPTDCVVQFYGGRQVIADRFLDDDARPV
jgi:hypothetical protein